MKSACIIGAGLGGLSAAIHLQLKGFAVTVFETNPTVGGRANIITRDGFTFDTGPSLVNYPWVFEELFSAAGKRLSDYVTLLPVDPTVEFRWPDGTQFRLSSDMKALLAECERLEPGSGPGTLAFFRDAAAKYRISFDKLVTRNEDNPVKWIGKLSPKEMWRTGVWRSLDAELRRFFKNRYMREALGSYGMYLGGSPYELPGIFTILSYGEMAYGLWLPKGGVYGLVSGIGKLARELGVTICTDTHVARIVTEGSRATGVELARGEKLTFDTVVSNCDVPTTDKQLLNISAKPRRMTPGVLTFYWGVRNAPKDIGHHTIFLPADNRKTFAELCKSGKIPGELPFYISMPSATDPDLAPPGHSSVFILVPTPVLSQLGAFDWDAAVASARTKILARLDLNAADILFEEVWTPVEWQRRFGLHDGSAFGAVHTLFEMGPFRAKNYSSRYQGLYYVGASTTPGTGMPMVVLGGRMTAERIAERVQ